MTEPQDAMERLERRVAQLETVVRALLAERGSARPLVAAPAPPPPPPPPPPRPSPQRPQQAAPVDALPVPPWPSEPPATHPRRFAARPARDWEPWVGQRGLLIVGVLALLATGGFFLNYAFDRGWVPEWLRATSTVLGGIGVGWWGDRLVVRGMRRYGAALIGAGGGLVYLGCWAAAGPYALVGKDLGVLLLAATSCAVALFAVRHDVEALPLWALAGADLAPAFLPHPQPDVEKFLAYLAVIGVSSLYLGHRFAWRRTFGVALFGFFVLPVFFVGGQLNTTTALGYATLGGVAALLMTEHRPWPEARLAALILPWLALLGVANDAPPDALRWPALGAGAFLAVVVWWQHRRLDPLARAAGGAIANLPEAVVFVASPLALVGLAALARPDALAPWGGAVPLALAGLYIGGGWRRRLGHLVGMGLALLALAVSGQWDGTAVAVGWALLAFAGIVADRSAGQPAACDVGVALGALAFVHLFAVALPLRPTGDAAFFGSWALGACVVLAALGLGARLWMPRIPTGLLADGGTVLWMAAGATLLAGGSVELQRYFRGAAGGFERATLAAHVAMALFWVLYGLALARFAPAWRAGRLRDICLAVAVLLPAAALLVLLGPALEAREPGDRAFLGVWSVGWYAVWVGPMLAARWWFAELGAAAAGDAARRGPPVLWTIGAVALFVGGSVELHRAFDSRLAADLAISTYWLLYAGTLVQLGFRRDRKGVRSAGLAVSGLAALKVVLYDLAQLEALYRVASFFALAVIALAVAYAYNRRAARRDL